MKRVDSSILRDWKQSYNLVKQDEGWLFLLSTMHRDV